MSNSLFISEGLLMQVLLVINSLYHGGAERVATTLCNALCAKGHAVTIMTLAKSTRNYGLADGVKLKSLDIDRACSNKAAAVGRFFSSVVALRKGIRDAAPDVVVAFLAQTNVLTLFACVGLGIPVLVSERCHPAYYSVGRGWGPIRSLAYAFADAVVVQTNDAAQWCREHFRLKALEVIPNPVFRSVISRASGHGERHRVVAAGRLTLQKGFDWLIEAFSRLAVTHSNWDLVIYGEGEERSLLEGLIDRYNLSGRVFLPGWSNRLQDEFSEADVFVLSSRFEGFPNVLCEAMAAGLPVVSFDCPSGPGDIVRENVDGYLVPLGDLQSLQERLAVLMDSPSLRLEMGRRAREVVDRFSVDEVVEQWEALFHRFVLDMDARDVRSS
jgi:glycosyltransferase involved in cell wall biosynthesis